MKEDLRDFNAQLDAANNKLTAQVRALAFQLIAAEEAERRAIARDLHDGLGQTLAIAKLKLDDLRAELSAPAQLKMLEAVEKLIGQGSQAIRSLATQLCPAVLYDIGLVPALRWLADEMSSEHGLRCEIAEDDQPKALDQSMRVILFRAVRELLLNVVKHAQVQAAEVGISIEAAGNGAARILKLVVRDNGTGFDPSALLTSSYSGFGLLGVRERLAYIGGDVNVASAPDRGTAVTLTVPLS